MDNVVKIPGILRDIKTPEGLIFVEVGYHRTDCNGHTCPFPFKIVGEYWPPHEIEKFENFVADEYNHCKEHEKENQTLDKSSDF